MSAMSEHLAKGIGYKHGLDAARAVKHEPAVGSFVHTAPDVTAAYRAGVDWWLDEAEQRRQERAL